METPHDRMVKHERMEHVEQQMMRPTRFSDGYDESMEETIKPGRKPNQRTQNVFEEMRRHAEHGAVPTPSRSSTMPGGKMYDAMGLQTPDFMSMNNFNAEFLKIGGGYHALDDANVLTVSPDMSEHTSPQTPHMIHYGAFDNKPDLHPPDMHSQPASPTRSGPSRRGSPHRRTESLASIASAASIASINIEETKTDTGVSIEDIAVFIQGPDPNDGKWLCLFEGCSKKFGRKENIKSHVQTHLNDRQYQCPTCKKCFVRQHDLKRHAKIHTGIKPYPCECGNSFARHDALTRHRQRGMCIGAFDGIVRKVVKRGRPRKHRPEMDVRMDKAARTRKKNQSISSTSSQSGYSDSSAANSPQNDFDMLDDDRFDLMDVAIEGPISSPILAMGLSDAPLMPILAPTDAPIELVHSPSAASQHSQHSYHSHHSRHSHHSHHSQRSQHSQHSYVSPEAIMEPPHELPEHPASPAKSVASQYNTPPELSQSSSPPPARYFDLEANTSGNMTDDSGLAGLNAGTPVNASGRNALSGTLTVGMSSCDQDEEMLLRAFTNDEGLVQLDRDPNMLMMSKFDEEFDNAVNMFTNSDEMFFGNA
jgi:regulatory protein SWI5